MFISAKSVICPFLFHFFFSAFAKFGHSTQHSTPAKTEWMISADAT